MRRIVLSAVAALLFSASVHAQSTVDSIAAKYKLIPMPGALTIEKTFPVLGSYQLNTPVADANTMTSTSETAGTTNSSSTTVTADATTGTTTTTASDATASGMEAAATGNITITLDSANKGIIWIEGLPEGTVKGYLQKSPSTYRIVSQETEDGKMTPEGTLILDTATKTLNIALGKAYNEVDPGSVFTMQDSIAAAAATTSDVDVKTTKSKSKAKSKVKEKPVTFYTATKVMLAEDATTAPADATQQQTTEQTTSGDSTQQSQNQNQNPQSNTQPTPSQP